VDDLGHFGEPSIVTFSSILGGAVTGAPGEAGLTAMSAGVASTERAGPGCLNSAPRNLSGFLPGYADCGASRF